MKTLFLSPPSFDGFDGGAGSRYQARREVTSFWYPTWLAQPAALVPDSQAAGLPAARHRHQASASTEAKDYDHVIIHTSTPSLKNDCKVAEAIKQNRPETKIGFVGAHAAVLPTETLKASPAIDWVGRKEFDYTCKEVAEGRPLETIAGLCYRDKDGKIKHNPEREMIADMDALPWVADVYKRDLQIEKYFIGYLLHPYVSLYTGRGCPAQCTFCLWPQTIGGHKYRVRSPQNVADEMAYMKKLFPQVREFFFDDDTFTANLPRAREIAKKLAPARPDLELQQPRQPRLRHDQVLQGLRPAPVPGRLRERQRADPQEHQEGRHARRDAPLHQGLPRGRRGHSRHLRPRPAGRDAGDHRGDHPLRAGTGRLQHAGLAWPRPIPAPSFTKWPARTAGSSSRTRPTWWRPTASSKAPSNIPGLSKEDIFEAVDRFYRAYYLRPKPILRIIKTMLEDKDVCVRRCREGYEFFKSLRQRKEDLAAAKCACQAPQPRPDAVRRLVLGFTVSYHPV